ncbi:MAG TPA: hypothetical protein VHU42_04350, partial [Rhodopila sp.]|nr:hypothetical protein [Rhodopila sp.]
GQMHWDDLGTFYDTWDDLPAIAYNSPFWLSASRLPAIIDHDHKVQTLNGVATNSTLTTGELGDDEAYTDLQYVRIRCTQDPTTGFMSGRHRETLGSLDFMTSETILSDGKFDVDVSARWHSVTFAFTGDMEMLGFTPTAVQDGLA